jgi:hypothetical protein
VANINSFLKQLVSGDSVRDYSHANKIFGRNALELSPKYSFLFHVFFDLANGVTYNKQNELGVLVKSVDLPRFDINTKTYNSYNRPNIVQSRISCQPITIIFHDDSANVIRNFWFDYYNFYYRNSDLAEPSYYNYDYKYASSNSIDKSIMGYTPKNDTKKYLQSIRIYSFSRKIASEYILINPIITQFQHGRHEYSNNNNTLEHTMTIEYETVLYKESPTAAVKGFGQSENYDTRPSPIAPGGGGTRSILGPGGLLGSADSFVKNLSEGNYLSAALGLAKTRQTFKGANLKNIALAEVQGLGRDVLRGQNPFSRISVPTLGDVTSVTAATAGAVRNRLPNTQNTRNTVDARPTATGNSGSTGTATSNSSEVSGP